MERKTYQKSFILDYLKNSFIHPSAERVYAAAQKKIPNISRGTVYRILNNLKEKEKIQEIPAKTFRYDGDISSHAHFICEKCGKIYDILDFCRECKILKRKRTKVGKIKKYKVYFYGICNKCQKKQQRSQTK